MAQSGQDPTQAWFWAPEWQAGEREADADRAAGRTETFGSGEGFLAALESRVKGIQGATGVFEMTRADDGRTTFEYGEPIVTGQPHVVWRRIGTHAIFKQP